MIVDGGSEVRDIVLALRGAIFAGEPHVQDISVVFFPCLRMLDA